jgi:hypothetical protein
VLIVQGLLKARRANLAQEFEDPRPGGRRIPKEGRGGCIKWYQSHIIDFCR